MHGRKKKADLPVSDEDRVEAETAGNLLLKILKLKSEGDRSSEALNLTVKVLKINPEIATVWNFRRELILAAECPDFIGEMKLLEIVLSKTLKSYCVWFHRRWCFDRMVEISSNVSELVHAELKLCEKLFSHDARNFHCWGYRTHVCSFLNEADRHAVNLQLSLALIQSDFSNYSAWHLRTKVTVEDVQGELEMIRSALFTEPGDQSVWQYRQWFLEKYGVDDTGTITELLSIEPDCKYALIAKGHSSGRLAEIDPVRRRYYLER